MSSLVKDTTHWMAIGSDSLPWKMLPGLPATSTFAGWIPTTTTTSGMST